MGGLLAIAVLVLYIWIWKKVFGGIQPVWGKALAVVLAILSGGSVGLDRKRGFTKC